MAFGREFDSRLVHFKTSRIYVGFLLFMEKMKERKKSMKRCKITAVRKTEYKDLMEKYENPIQHACDIEEGQVFITEGWKRPKGFCESAWESISPFVMTLAYGGSDIYEGWMKNKNSAMISCNDGFRPVSFYIEVLDEKIY